MALHGVPHTQIEKVDEYFKPYRDLRNRRNRKMVERINSLVGQQSLTLDFDRDVAPLSQSDKGGSITERHVLYGLTFETNTRIRQGQA